MDCKCHFALPSTSSGGQSKAKSSFAVNKQLLKIPVHYSPLITHHSPFTIHHFTTHHSPLTYSLLKLFTGFATAAFTAWKLIVITEIKIAMMPANRKTHQ